PAPRRRSSHALPVARAPGRASPGRGGGRCARAAGASHGRCGGGAPPPTRRGPRAPAPPAAPPPGAPCGRRWRGIRDRTGGPGSGAGSPEERAPRREAGGQPGGDPRLHLLHLLAEHLVLVAWVPREVRRLAEGDPVA